jgi:hypothetical protein
MDAALRARGETRHLFTAYAVKAAATVPLVWIGVTRFGIAGGVASYVATEVVGKIVLAWRLPRALGAPGSPAPLRALVPWRELGGAAAGSLAAALTALVVVHAVPAPELAGTAATALYRFVPLAIAGSAAGLVYLGALRVMRVRPAVALDALRSRGTASTP